MGSIRRRSGVRARAASLEWLATRLGPLVEDRAAAEGDGEVLEEVKASTVAVHEFVREKLAHQAPTFSDVINGVKTYIEQVAATAPAEPAAGASEGQEATDAAPSDQEAPAASAAAPQPAPQPASQPEPAAAPEAAATAPARAKPATTTPAPAALPSDASLSDLRSHVVVLAGALRQADPLSPTPYRMLRSLKWDNIQGPPPADPGGSGKTRVPAPRAQQRMALDSMVQGQRWRDLVNAAEGAFQDGTGTFWLDLQRFTAIALEKMDSSDSRAARAVKADTAKLVELYPNLPGLLFADDSPFAADATREWLEEIGGGPGLSAMFAPPVTGGGAEGSALESSELEQAAELFAKKKPAAALALLQRWRRSRRYPPGSVPDSARDRPGVPPGQSAGRGRGPFSRISAPSWRGSRCRNGSRSWRFRSTSSPACAMRGSPRTRKTDDRETVRELLEEVKARLFRLDMRAAAVVEEAS